MKRALCNLSLALCAVAFASCSDYQTSTTSWWFRYHPEEDEAVYVEIQDGVTANADAAETLRRLVEGWRRYPPEGGLVVIDLETEPDWDEEDPRHQEKIEGLKELFQGLQREIKVVEAGMFRVGEDGLGFYRVTHIKDLSLALDALNTFCNAAFSQEWSDGIEIDSDYFEMGSETKARWMQRVNSNEPWLTRQGSAIVLDLPMTDSEATGLLRELIEQGGKGSTDTWYVKALDEIRIADGSLRLTFAPEGNRLQSINTDGSDSQNKDHAALIEALKADPGFTDFDRAGVLERVK